MKSRFATILVTAVITAVVTSLLWGVGIFVVVRYFTGSPPPFAVRVDAPTEIALGETVDVRVEVTNPTADPLELGSIDVYDSLLGGFTVEEVTPEVTERDHTLDFSTFYLRKSLAPGKTLTVRFRLKGAKAGVWTGDIDCCTPTERFVSSSLTIKVTDSNGGAEPKNGQSGKGTPGAKRAPPAEL